MKTTLADVHETTRWTIAWCREHGYNEIAQKLDDAMHLGSSGLEILAGIKGVFISHRAVLEKAVGQKQVRNIIKCIDKAFGH
jgi:hypothetical protein